MRLAMEWGSSARLVSSARASYCSGKAFSRKWCMRLQTYEAYRYITAVTCHFDSK